MSPDKIPRHNHQLYARPSSQTHTVHGRHSGNEGVRHSPQEIRGSNEKKKRRDWWIMGIRDIICKTDGQYLIFVGFASWGLQNTGWAVLFPRKPVPPWAGWQCIDCLDSNPECSSLIRRNSMVGCSTKVLSGSWARCWHSNYFWKTESPVRKISTT